MAEKNIKRDDILVSAKILFKENGFHKTKMEDIALKAGVGKGTLYEYFNSKQEIFDEACVDYIRTIYEYVEDIRTMNIPFLDKLALLFKESEISAEQEIEKNPIDYIMSYKNIISEKFVLTMFEYISNMNKIIIEIINQGKEEGIVRNDIPSEIIACSIIGTMGEYIKLKIHNKDKITEDNIIFNLLLNGFGVK